MFWLKKTTAPEPLAVSMSGIKLGDRLLVVGAGDGALIAQLAKKTGLTGRACAVDEDAPRIGHARQAAEREGALVETFTSPWTEMPLDDGSFDVVVIRDVLAFVDLHRRAPLLSEVLRLLRPGGRCIVVEGGGRGGLGALFHSRTPHAEYTSSGGAAQALSAAGFRATRTLAERGSLLFVEGVKPVGE